MAEDEQFSLCWNNFNSNLSAGFHESLCRGDLVDVTLAAEGQLVKAHRLVLSVCSPYFRNMFNQMPANQHAFVFLKDVSHSALKDLIQFMYCGEVNVKQDALATFISTAEALQIKGLTESGETAAPSSPSKTVQVSNTISTSPRVRQQPRTISRTAVYKLESEDSSDDKPIAQKRSQRVIASSSGLKRLKTEPAESTIIGTVDTKGDGDFIELPIEIPTKSETEYADDTEEVEGGEQETTYVEDETYGDMKYDETYFTENDETGKAGMSGFSETYEGDTTTEGQVKKRGRKSTKTISPKPITLVVEDIIRTKESLPIEYVPMKFGGMKVAFKGNHFSYHFSKKGIAYWRCLNHEKSCPAKMVSRSKEMWIVDGHHNHKEKALVKEEDMKEQLPKTTPSTSIESMRAKMRQMIQLKVKSVSK